MGLWLRSPHQQFTLKVGSPALANVSFNAPWESYGVVVANHTNQYVFFQDVNWYVPPGVVGATIPLPGLMEATASFAAPPGMVAAPTITGQVAILDYFAEELTPFPGVPTNVSTQSPQTSLGHFQGAAGSQTLTLPTGCHCVAVLSKIGPANLSLLGVTSGAQYAPLGLASGNFGLAQVISGVDLQLTLSWSASPVNTEFWVVAILGEELVTLTTNPGFTGDLTVKIDGLVAGNLTNGGQKAMLGSFPVVIASDQSRADASTLAVSATGIAGAAVTLTLPALAGRFHYITFIRVVRFAAALLTAAATPVLVTTTNLPGTPTLSLPADAAAQGTAATTDVVPTTPIKSSALNTDTTIVCPATPNVIWRVNAWYYPAFF